MRERWKVLFIGSIIALVGMSWLATKLHASMSMFGMVRLVGMILCAGVAGWATHVDCRVKWPAAVALVCSGPIAVDAVQAVPNISLFVQYLGIPVLALIGGACVVVYSAMRILMQQIPPLEPPIAVAVARVVDSD